jgi:hypothetical protein
MRVPESVRHLAPREIALGRALLRVGLCQGSEVARYTRATNGLLDNPCPARASMVSRMGASATNARPVPGPARRDGPGGGGCRVPTGFAHDRGGAGQRARPGRYGG